MRLNDDALRWLGSKGGRIGTIDVQIGCPDQCILCGVNAERYNGSMPHDDYKQISESILELKTKKGIDVLSEKVYPFNKSNPPYYHSKEWTMHDIVTDLIVRHDKKVFITISGWTHGNNYMQKAMEKIVEDYSDESSSLCMLYSVKTVSEHVRREYASFMQKQKSLQASDEEFIKQSRYVSRVIDNMRTLHKISVQKPSDAYKNAYEFQFLNKEDIDSLKPEYYEYKTLFSKEFMKKLMEHIQGAIDTREYLFKGRAFVGMGKALNIGDIKATAELKDYTNKIDKNLRTRFWNDKYYVNINGRGEIEIYYGDYKSLASVLVPKEYFIAMAEKSILKDMKNKYLMLSNLQGKSLL